jgi:predicted DNA binding protein
VSTIARLEVPAAGFALDTTLAAVPDATLEIEPVAAHATDCVTPYMWARTEDRETLDRALSKDESVRSAELIERSDNRWLYRIDWTDEISFIDYLLSEENATIIDASGARNAWTLSVRFPERDSLSRAFDYCTERGVSPSVLSIRDTDSGRGGSFGLTDRQFEALGTAYESGYYEIPRRTDLSELAEKLGISHQALSERIRRAHGNLVEGIVNGGR